MLDKFPTEKKPPRRCSDDTIATHYGSVERRPPEEMADIWVGDYDEAESKALGESVVRTYLS